MAECKYCASEYNKEEYGDFCSRTCTNKHHDTTFIRGEYSITPYETFDIADSKLGFFVFSKEDNRPRIGSFETAAEALKFAQDRVNGSH